MPNTTSNMGLHQGIDGDNSKTLIETHYAADATVIDTHDHSTNAKGLSVSRITAGTTISNANLTGTVTGSATHTTPTLTSPVVSGAAATAAGTLGFSGTNLLVGDGSAIESVNIGAWTTFTPTLTQGVSVSITVNVARYVKIGRTAIVFIQLTASSSGTSSSVIDIGGIPAAIAPLTANSATPVGPAYLGFGNVRIGAAVWASSTDLEIWVDNNNNLAGAAPVLQLVNGIVVSLTGTWETAS